MLSLNNSNNKSINNNSNNNNTAQNQNKIELSGEKRCEFALRSFVLEKRESFIHRLQLQKGAHNHSVAFCEFPFKTVPRTESCEIPGEMQPNEHLKKVMKIFIFAFLCTEMRTSYTHCDGTAKQRGIEANAKRRSTSRAPFQASIRLKELELDYYGKGHICSGALVAPSVVLTVAHCVYNNGSKSFYHPAELRVQLGSTQRFAPTSQSQLFGVTHVYQPPKSLSLAILMLDQDVAADQGDIQPMALSTQPLHSTTRNVDESYTLSSWGLMDHEHQELHEMLSIPVDCRNQVCATRDSRYLAYTLDAGAPLTSANQLVGLLSQSGYVEVVGHADWIHAKTGDGSTQNSCWWGILGLLVFTGYVIRCSSKSLRS